MRLTITRVFAVAELGTIAFVDVESVALAFGARHQVRITRPNGRSVEAVASVESVRNDSSGAEFVALLFETLALHEVAAGSSVLVIGEAAGV